MALVSKSARNSGLFCGVKIAVEVGIPSLKVLHCRVFCPDGHCGEEVHAPSDQSAYGHVCEFDSPNGCKLILTPPPPPSPTPHTHTYHAPPLSLSLSLSLSLFPFHGIPTTGEKRTLKTQQMSPGDKHGLRHAQGQFLLPCFHYLFVHTGMGCFAGCQGHAVRGLR